MQEVVIIPKQEWDLYLEREKERDKRLARLEKGLTETVDTKEAMRLTGLSKTGLYYMRKDGRLTDVGNGKTVKYLRSECNAFTEGKIPRHKLKIA